MATHIGNGVGGAEDGGRLPSRGRRGPPGPAVSHPHPPQPSKERLKWFFKKSKLGLPKLDLTCVPLPTPGLFSEFCWRMMAGEGVLCDLQNGRSCCGMQLILWEAGG